jgi:L-seryl-tRNA(Ser) seleniumtransferase
MKVHQSNFRIVGFTQAVGVPELASLGLPVVADLGSGLLDAATPWLHDGPPSWLAGEPAARQTLAAGATVVMFSGDKLLGGPQAGILAGTPDVIGRCASHPLYRALRPGALVLEALQATALAYLHREATAIPFWQMASRSTGDLRQRAEAIASTAGIGEAVDCQATAGGGSSPGLVIPSAGVAVRGDHTAALRRWDPPVIARVQEGSTVLDLRAVDPDDDERIAKALAALSGLRELAGLPGDPGVTGTPGDPA